MAEDMHVVTLSDDVFQAVETYKFQHHCTTKSEATEKLIELGLQALNDHASQDERRAS